MTDKPVAPSKTWSIAITEDEIQCIANLLQALFKMATERKIAVPPIQAFHAAEFLHRCKRTMDKKPLVVVPQVSL